MVMYKMTVIEILKTARTKLASGWIQGDFARDANGKIVSSISADAVCWCTAGALRSLQNDGDWIGARIALLTELGSDGMLSTWNDDPCRTQKEVLELFDKAIRRLENAQ